MNLLLAGPSAAAGPLPKIAKALIAEFRQDGWTVTQCSWGEERVRVTLFARIVRTVRDIHAIVKRGREHTCDAALINTAHDWRTLSRDVPLLLAMKIVANIPVVVWLHGSDVERLCDFSRWSNVLFRLASRIFVKLADAVILLSTEEQRSWQRFDPAVDFRIARLTVPGRITRRGRLAMPVRILFVGRLIDRKGVLDAIAAMPEVLRRQPCTLTIVGDGPLRSQAEVVVKSLKLQNSIEFTGYLDDDALQEQYRHAYALILPTYHPEGFPVVILEAMRAGLPIVTTRIRGAADWLTDPANALFVPRNDPSRLAQAIITLLNDPKRAGEMGHRNRQLAAAVFGPAIVAKDWQSQLLEITKLDRLRRCHDAISD